MPICKQCNESFPFKVKINGKTRIMSKRKYCLKCSPFGLHNTRHPSAKLEKFCKDCGVKLRDNRRNFCGTCISRNHRYKVADKIYSITGSKCYICGYGDDTKRSVLDFHHMDSKNKLFPLTLTMMGTKSYSDILLELRKCVLLCCRCHREFENGLIEKSKITKAYNEQWRITQVGKEESLLNS